MAEDNVLAAIPVLQTEDTTKPMAADCEKYLITVKRTQLLSQIYSIQIAKQGGIFRMKFSFDLFIDTKKGINIVKPESGGISDIEKWYEYCDKNVYSLILSSVLDYIYEVEKIKKVKLDDLLLIFLFDSKNNKVKDKSISSKKLKTKINSLNKECGEPKVILEKSGEGEFVLRYA